MNRLIVRRIMIFGGLLVCGLPAVQARQPVSITVTLASAPTSVAIPPDFSGLSFGAISLQNGALFYPGNAQLIALFQSLGIKSLRIGGTSVDQNSSNYTPSLTDIDALFLFAQAANLKVIYSLRLFSTAQIQTSTATADAQIAQYIWQHYPGSLVSFAIGNEPENYIGDPLVDGQSGSNEQMYLTDWQQFANTIFPSVLGALFGGPDTGVGNGWEIAFAQSISPPISIYTHNYVAGSSAGKTVQQLVDDDLSSSLVTSTYPQQNTTSVQPVLTFSDPYRFTEADAHATSDPLGVPGGDNAFATALFALDFMHWWAARGLSGVNFHTSMWKYNGVIYPDSNGNYQVYPSGYGIKAFALGSSGSVVPLTISNPAGTNVTAYAEADASFTYVTIINKTHASNSVSPYVLIRPTRPGPPSAVASLALAGDAPGDGASLTATLGGAPIQTGGQWQGQWQTLTWDQTMHGVVVYVPAASAAVIKFQYLRALAQPVIQHAERPRVHASQAAAPR